jgi:hypothetical protein
MTMILHEFQIATFDELPEVAILKQNNRKHSDDYKTNLQSWLKGAIVDAFNELVLSIDGHTVSIFIPRNFHQLNPAAIIHTCHSIVTKLEAKGYYLYPVEYGGDPQNPSIHFTLIKRNR